jgi:2-polyprenyl-3-methyl-5-hydroxy-6-metoxy-1,4-benzoquinol methylase
VLPDKLKGLLGGAKRHPPAGAAPAAAGSRGFASGKAGADPVVIARTSRGLEEFFAQIRGQSGLTILDFGPATQQNVSFITNLGHRLYSEDFLKALHETFGVNDTVDQSNPGRIEYFLKAAMDYPDGHFDGVLIWDVLEYLDPPLLAAVVERLRRIVREKSLMLAFFHSDDKRASVPYYTFRIQELNLLQVTQEGHRKPARLFNNRDLEKLFGSFNTVKFFLTREQLREVIVKT